MGIFVIIYIEQTNQIIIILTSWLNDINEFNLMAVGYTECYSIII